MFGFWILLSVLALVTGFGAGVALNMVFRRWWFALVVYGVFSVYLFVSIGGNWNVERAVLYALGLASVMLATYATRALKKRGYPLFVSR